MLDIAHGREIIEEIIKAELIRNPGERNGWLCLRLAENNHAPRIHLLMRWLIGSPGQFYPFMSGKIREDSPLGLLLARHGITPENSNQFEGTANW